MTCLNDLGRRSLLKRAAALGGASAVGALPNLAGAQEMQTVAPDAKEALEAGIRIANQDCRLRPAWHQDLFGVCSPGD